MVKNKAKWLADVKSLSHKKTPFIITDLGIIKRKSEEIKALLPRVKIFYALKSNNDTIVLKTLKPLVDGFDIASLGEMRLLDALKINPERVIYSNPVKLPDHINVCFQKGVRYYALDSLDEIKKMSRYAPGASVFLRIQVSDYGSKFPLSRKFGLVDIHVPDFAEAAQAAGLNVCGLAFHVGSQAENLQIWDTALELSSKLIHRLSQMAINIKYLDMGGGFPADYGQPIPTIRQICRTINRALATYIPKHIEVFAEPGRYISANAAVTVTSVIAREHRTGSDWLYLDTGVFQGLMEPLEMKEWRYPIYTEKTSRGYRKSFVLTGPTCDAYDILGYDYLLPADVNMGDRLVIDATGAYAAVYGSNFNGFELPARYYVKGGTND